MVEDTRIDRSSRLAAGALSGSAPAHEGARIVTHPRTDDCSGPGPEVMPASAFEGEKVVNLRGETLGEIEEIMLDVRGGRIAYAVLAVGGLLGLGEKYFAIPWTALTFDTDRHCFVLDADKERLNNAAGIDKENWPVLRDRSWA